MSAQERIENVPSLAGEPIVVRHVESFAVPPRWVFVRVATESGLVGWGEASLEGNAEAVMAAVATLGERLIGRDARLVNDFFQLGSRGGFYRGGPVLSSALAGLDQALWDLAGRAAGVPVHQLLGGPVRSQVRAYSWIGGDRPGDVAAAAKAMVAAGRTAVKMNGSAELEAIDTVARTEEVVERVAAVREVLGPDRDVAVDFHGRVSPAMARRLLPLLAPYSPLFVEEPVLPELAHRLPDLVRASPIPIATGERLYSRFDFRPVLEAGVSVVQPDLSHACGISEVLRIAALAEVYGAVLAPHCPLGPLALAACLQVAAVVPNFLIQEHAQGIHYNVDSELADYLLDPSPIAVVEGFVTVPSGPGLGVEIDEERVRALAGSTSWRTPVWRHRDGSVAEW